MLIGFPVVTLVIIRYLVYIRESTKRFQELLNKRRFGVNYWRPPSLWQPAESRMSKSSDLNLYDLSDVESILNDPELSGNSKDNHQDTRTTTELQQCTPRGWEGGQGEGPQVITTRGWEGGQGEGPQVITTRGLQLEECIICATDEEDNISQTPDSVQTQLTIVQMA